MGLNIEAILYNRVIHTGWQAVNGETDQETGSGGHHFCLDAMESGKPTTEFLGVEASNYINDSDGYEISNVRAIGDPDQSATVTFKDWGGDREQWTIADQLTNRHPALHPTNGMPEYEDEELWDGDGYESDNYQTNLVIYLVRCTNGDHYMGYHLGDDLPDEWPEAELTHSPHTDPSHRVGYIELSPSQNLTTVSKEVLGSLDNRKNVLLYGPPGTGKTLAMKQISEVLRDPDSLGTLVLDASVDPSGPDSPFSWESLGSVPIDEPVYTDWVTFHQGTTNEEFVVGLRPKPTGGGVELEARAGTLFEAIRAIESGEYGSAVLFIDEVNRANTASVLGEFMTFLEPDKRDLSFRPTSLSADTDNPDQTQQIRFSRKIEGRELVDRLGYPVDVPDSLYIVGTMNSLDRSVAPLDQALARRFHRVDVFPDSEVLLRKLGVEEEEKSYSDLSSLDGSRDTAFHLLNRLNKYIRHSLGREYQFGHGYLEGVWMANNREESWRQLVEVWETEFLPQLEEFFRTRREVLVPILLGEEEVPPSSVPSDGQEYPYKMEPPPDGSPFQVQDDMLSYEDAAISNLGQEAQREVLAYLALGDGPDETEIDENISEDT